MHIFHCYISFMGSVMKILFSNKMVAILMGMEMLMLSVFFLLGYDQYLWFIDSISLMVFFTFMVSESVLGLGLYIYITRLIGIDNFKSSILLK